MRQKQKYATLYQLAKDNVSNMLEGFECSFEQFSTNEKEIGGNESAFYFKTYDENEAFQIINQGFEEVPYSDEFLPFGSAIYLRDEKVTEKEPGERVLKCQVNKFEKGQVLTERSELIKLRAEIKVHGLKFIENNSESLFEDLKNKGIDQDELEWGNVGRDQIKFDIFLANLAMREWMRRSGFKAAFGKYLDDDCLALYSSKEILKIELEDELKELREKVKTILNDLLTEAINADRENKIHESMKKDIENEITNKINGLDNFNESELEKMKMLSLENIITEIINARKQMKWLLDDLLSTEADLLTGRDGNPPQKNIIKIKFLNEFKKQFIDIESVPLKKLEESGMEMNSLTAAIDVYLKNIQKAVKSLSEEQENGISDEIKKIEVPKELKEYPKELIGKLFEEAISDAQKQKKIEELKVLRKNKKVEINQDTTLSVDHKTIIMNKLDRISRSLKQIPNVRLETLNDFEKFLNKSIDELEEYAIKKIEKDQNKNKQKVVIN